MSRKESQDRDLLGDCIAIDALLSAIIYFDENSNDGVRACHQQTLAIIAREKFSELRDGIDDFVGRLDDIGEDGMKLIADIREIYDNYSDSFRTEILVASIRHPLHVVEAARLGADVATIPAKVLRQLVAHALTDKGLATFLADWGKTGQAIVED